MTSVGSSVDNRKDLLLLALAANQGEPVVGVTRLQKYLYLLQEQSGWKAKLPAANRYRFRNYDYGPFDDQVYADLDFLENVGLIVKEPAGRETLSENGEDRLASESWATADPEFAPWSADEVIWSYRLTSKGRTFVQDKLPISDDEAETIGELKTRWNGTPLTEFLRWLYTTYPDVAENTKLKHLTA